MSKISFPETDLPAFTRADFWWLMTIGLLHLLAAAYFFLLAALSDGDWIVFLIVLSFAAGALTSSVLLCVKRRNAWITSVAILSIMLIFVIALSLIYLNIGRSWIAVEIFYVVAMLIPLITVILNRPKYVAMLRKMEHVNNKSTT